ncbi:uncharacterized protein LOC131943696 [Physella acuta]|uniref:uncharacterized protein LOC131943696 n=1 Tax=Physella acuta TaxID=109671 RepID=UPI0027DE065B|nr:uncharacterized protein LOC131943696 [Physella acuta]
MYKKMLFWLFWFLVWTLTSFTSHYCGKMFIQNSQLMEAAGWTFAVCLTIVQSSAFVAAMKIQVSGHWLILGSHILSTLMTNLSMAATQASSTFTIKMLEPVVMLVVSRSQISTQKLISIPVIFIGAFLFTGILMARSGDLTGIIFAFLSNIFLAVRNTQLKRHNTKIKLKHSKCPPQITTLASVAGVCLLAGLSVFNVFSNLRANLIFLVLGSAACHVTYTSVSTEILKRMSDTVSHSVANIAKRLLIVLFMYATGQRQAGAMNGLGLVVCTVGLLACFREDSKHRAPPEQDAEGHTTADSSEPRKLVLFSMWSIAILIIAIVNNEKTAGTPSVKKIPVWPDVTTLETPSRLVDYNVTSHVTSDQHQREITLPEFLSWNLTEHPYETNLLASRLTKHEDIVSEAQRVLMNILSELTRGADHVMLMEIAVYENKGDPAISAGEVFLLKKLNKTIIYYCSTFECTDNNLDKAVNISNMYPPHKLVIFMQGGGNIAMYPAVDLIRRSVIQRFSKFRMVVFSQSVYYHFKEDILRCQKIYSNVTNLTMLIRDKQSYGLAKSYFKGVQIILAPDMAFGIGVVKRTFAPAFDILWLRRQDDEAKHYIKSFQRSLGNVTIHVADWWKWLSNKGESDMETAFNIAHSGLVFLQRGRVVITDRLHGHILSTLLRIPHVIVDNPPARKLSSFHTTWTAGLSDVTMVTNETEALDSALLLLLRFSDKIPEVFINNAKIQLGNTSAKSGMEQQINTVLKYYNVFIFWFVVFII